MKNEMKIFESPEFGRIRVVMGEAGEPWFIGKDAAIVLGYSNVRDALYKHVDKEDKGVCQNSHPLLKYHKARTFTSSGFAIP